MTDYFTEYDSILENLLGIDDPIKLKEAEEIFVNTRLVALDKEPIHGDYDFIHLLEIHKYLFGDIYPFAGKIRTVDIAKGGFAFCYVKNIMPMQVNIFNSLKRASYYVGLERMAFIDSLSQLAGDLNALHPFREGNGRAIRAFLRELSSNAGYTIDYGETNKQDILEADIAALYGDMKPIKKLFSSIIHHAK